MLRKPFAWFFLFIFLANTAGLGLFSAFLLRQHRQEMKALAKSASGETLRIALADLHSGNVKLDWVKADEFELGGNRYDVISMTQENDHLVFRCINDTKEKSLERQLAQQSEENSDSPAKKNSSAKKGLGDFLSETGLLPVPPPSSPAERSECVFHIPGTFLPVSSPPPWLG